VNTGHMKFKLGLLKGEEPMPTDAAATGATAAAEEAMPTAGGSEAAEAAAAAGEALSC
jgi:hypothetical protein